MDTGALYSDYTALIYPLYRQLAWVVGLDMVAPYSDYTA